MKLGGKVESRPLLIPLDLPNSNTLYIVQLAADGFIYVIDGFSGCYDKLNIGETSYSMILADDFNNNGKTDLLVSTSNGHVFLLSTNAEFHPLHAWYIINLTSQFKNILLGDLLIKEEMDLHQVNFKEFLLVRIVE